MNDSATIVEIAPHENAPTVTFAEAAVAGAFHIAFFIQGVPQGYLGNNGKGWAVLVSDISEATKFQFETHGSETYIQSMDESNSYLSVGTVGVNKGYVGFYSWARMGNAAWRVEGTPPKQTLVSAINENAMSLYSKENAYIYCWPAYTTLNVELQY
jgi:hypothetical protein